MNQENDQANHHQTISIQPQRESFKSLLTYFIDHLLTFFKTVFRSKRADHLLFQERIKKYPFSKKKTFSPSEPFCIA